MNCVYPLRVILSSISQLNFVYITYKTKWYSQWDKANIGVVRLQQREQHICIFSFKISLTWIMCKQDKRENWVISINITNATYQKWFLFYLELSWIYQSIYLNSYKVLIIWKFILHSNSSNAIPGNFYTIYLIV